MWGGVGTVTFSISCSMKETFETNMAAAKEEEELGISQFAELKKAKTSEIAAAEDRIETKTLHKQRRLWNSGYPKSSEN